MLNVMYYRKFKHVNDLRMDDDHGKINFNYESKLICSNLIKR